jgi:hypothetical protein
VSEAAESHTPSPSDPSESARRLARAQAVRRRLLVGTVAVLPSVYTLSSGARTAVASNLRCWNRAQSHGGRELVGTPGGDDEAARFSMMNDEWLRKQVYTGMGGGHPAYCAMSNQAACIDPAQPSKAAQGSVWIINGERIVAGAGIEIDQVSASPQAYGLVFVDQQGTIATLDPERTADLRPVKEPCWTSMLGGRVSNLG